MDQIASGSRAFALRHRWDRAFFLIYLVLIWAGIVGGFGLDMLRKAAKGGLHYPLAVHAHAVVFGGWLLLLTAQIVLVESGNLRIHRKLGVVAVVLLPLMLILGPMAAIAMLRLHPDKLDKFAFLSTQLTNVLGSVALSTAGLLVRRDPSAHKRLMLIGTIAIMEPGFSRIWAGALFRLLGEGYWQYWVGTYVGSIAMLLGVGAYDLATRRRLHPVYLPALAWCLAMEWGAAWLYYQPWWAAMMKRVVMG
ncbi:MAG TPA: hypothetical protein VN137_12175 [Sphingomonas sp.]|nr:hypothetical protein [Sphingomonas sp.]